MVKDANQETAHTLSPQGLGIMNGGIQSNGLGNCQAGGAGAREGSVGFGGLCIIPLSFLMVSS